MNEYKINENKLYRLTKINEDGTQEIKGIGYCSDVLVGRSCWCGYWHTSTVQRIELTGKGCLFDTLNSTYLLEEDGIVYAREW